MEVGMGELRLLTGFTITVTLNLLHLKLIWQEWLALVQPILTIAIHQFNLLSIFVPMPF